MYVNQQNNTQNIRYEQTFKSYGLTSGSQL